MVWITGEWPIWCDYVETAEQINTALERKGITILIEDKNEY